MIICNDENIANRCKEYVGLGQIYKSSGLPAYPSLDFSEEIDHNQVGYTYRMSPLFAVIGLTQIKRLRNIVEKRKKIVDLYKEELKKIGFISFPNELTAISFCYNNFPIILNGDYDNEMISEICLKAGLPILKTYYSEILGYKIFQKYLKDRNLTNTMYFDKHNLILPIFVNLPITENRRFIRKFIEILEGCR